MIDLLERGRNIRSPVSTQYLGKRILGEYSLYDGSQSFFRSQSALMMIQGSTLSYVGDGSDMEEVSAFAGFIGVRRIESERKLPVDLPESELLLMKYCSGKKEQGRFAVTVSEDIYSFAEFMHEHYPKTDMGFLYPFLVHRVRRRSLDVIYIIDEKGVICSGCMESHFDGISYVSAVFTAPEHRGKGMASSVICETVKRRNGRELFLCCEEDMRSYYEELGFEKTGSVYRYILCEETE